MGHIAVKEALADPNLTILPFKDPLYKDPTISDLNKRSTREHDLKQKVINDN